MSIQPSKKGNGEGHVSTEFGFSKSSGLLLGAKQLTVLSYSKQCIILEIVTLLYLRL